MAKSPNWTETEISLLKEYYPTLGKSKELEKLFPNRTLDSICLKANRLGLKVINNIRKGRTNEEYLYLVENTNFVPLEPYKGSTVPILHMCGICDYEWLARPQHILKSLSKCPNCSYKSRFVSIEEVDRIITQSGCIRLSDYIGCYSPLKLKHIHCGNIWTTKYSYIQQGSGCPVCNKSWAYSGINTPEKAKIYLLEITTAYAKFLKIGVTVQKINKRINELKYSIPECLEIKEVFSIEHSGKHVLILEDKILIKSNLIKYNSPYQFAGYKELLDISNDITDIIKLMSTNENI